MTTEEYAADLAARFEAMAELEREREAAHRAEGMHRLAAVRSVYAHANMLAAKMVRDDARRMARTVRRCGRRAA